MKKALLIVGLLLLSILVASCSPKVDYTAFATCLTDNGAKMYGAYWCGHCENQKKSFGDAVGEVNYIECSLPNRAGQTAICEQAGITSYPTWEFADGSRQSGVVPFEELGRRTGCELPA